MKKELSIERLRELCGCGFISQRGLAITAKVSEHTMRRIIDGTRPFNVIARLKIEKTLSANGVEF